MKAFAHIDCELKHLQKLHISWDVEYISEDGTLSTGKCVQKSHILILALKCYTLRWKIRWINWHQILLFKSYALRVIECKLFEEKRAKDSILVLAMTRWPQLLLRIGAGWPLHITEPRVPIILVCPDMWVRSQSGLPKVDSSWQGDILCIQVRFCSAKILHSISARNSFWLGSSFFKPWL